ncbi:phosphoglycerate dehydrogenase [Acetanaerobacterium elongatum]|uniref:D-3-phosphoglycerate dehydrogenase n=1 Tax=Acetanaerobacterium elongatum TaxID=258515 RepID=A0A1G9Z5X0_9FIRM|nr:phosphoglycerate dehydrogenase [Acetanaerobacterium elongatum]SDN16191.1 D-3-phosphoglycerate dehydrogenase [Acetanaerobacterium elongatum]
MYNILTLNKISPIGLDRFDSGSYRCADAVENPDAVLVRSASMHDTVLPASLKAIARAGAGTNNIPVEACTEKGIVVFNTPGANANAVKELVIAALLLSSRKIYPAMQWVQTLKESDGDISKQVEKGKGDFVGPEIMGKKLGVIGLGAIGILVANAAQKLGMEVYGYDPYLSVEAAWGLSHSIHHAKSLNEIYENCDYITLHVPLTPETKGLVNSASIARMKHGVRIMNFSRGDLVVDDDMLAALGEKQVRVYVTDFPSACMIGHPGVLAIPHLGASTPESEDNCARMAADELIDYLENGNITNSVNFPNVEMPRSTAVRVGVIHKNIPNMLTSITSAMANLGINIDNLINKSKKDNAYTLLDISGSFDEESAKKLSAIEGIIRVQIYK